MKSKASKQGKRNRRKGIRWELEGVHMFRKAMPGESVYRGSQASGGGRAADVEAPKFWPEFRHQINPSIRQALLDATLNAPAGRWPFAAVKRNRERPIGAMWLDEMMELIAEWWDMRQNWEPKQPPKP